MIQTNLLSPAPTWQPPNLNDLPSWKGVDRVAIDIETCDPYLTDLGPSVRRGGFMCGISFAIENGPSYYVPFKHFGGGNVDFEMAMRYFQDQAKVFKGDLVGANIPYDLDYMAEKGIHWKPRRIIDIQIDARILDEHRLRSSLKALGEEYGILSKDEGELRAAAKAHDLDPKKDMWKLHAGHVARYAICDVESPLIISRKQEAEIKEQGLERVRDLECRVIPACVAMRRRGVKVDLDQLAHFEQQVKEREQECLDQINEKTRHITKMEVTSADVNTTEVWARVVHAIGATCPKTKGGEKSPPKDSVTEAFLKSLQHPVADLIIETKKTNKMQTTFIASVRKHIVGDRIHCTFNQMKVEKEDGDEKGARFGRLSCSDPNMQQQPSRGKWGKLWRKIYIPDEGKIWACLDYSQQEPRILTHYATLNMAGTGKQLFGRALQRRSELRVKAREVALEMARRYNSDPKADNHTMMAQIICGEGPDWVPPDDVRKDAKETLLARCYGQSGASLAEKWGLPTQMKEINGEWVKCAGEEAQAIINKFDQALPYVKMLAKETEAIAKQRGYIKTIYGRRCRFERDKNTGEYFGTYRALNRLIQGSAADQTKIAVACLHEEGIPLQLQVHDEVDFSAESREQAEHCAQIMQDCLPMNVRARVDVELGPNWGEIK